MNMLVKGGALLKLVVVLGCVLLAACTDCVSTIKPVDVSLANQMAQAQFVVNKTGKYRIAFLFVISKHGDKVVPLDMDLIGFRERVWGNVSYSGVLIPVRVKIVKDGEVFLREEINSENTYGSQDFKYDGVGMFGAVRFIEWLKLEPGNYYLEVETLEGVEAFKDIETYVEFSCFNPKH